MKKLFYFAAAAMMLAACTSEELNVQDQQKLVEDNAAVNFDVYAQRGITRAGAPNDISNTSIQTGAHKDVGFGVFAYYTDGKLYDNSATPNFMYNQQVTYNGTKWTYEPVKYWPNEFGDAAKADEVDYLTFFAYAPWTQLVPTTGKPDTKGIADADLENYQTKNIIQVTDNKKTGDPIIKYVVDTNPETSVDLLWGVNADPTGWAPIQTNGDAQNEAGLPFTNLTKPITPFDAAGGKIKFNLRHALAKVKITIDYIADDNTPDPSANYNPADANKIDADQTRIFVRWIQMNGFALEGALNLNNTEPNKPLWKDFNNNELNFDEIIFNDGRKDGKEGSENGSAKEANMYLNPEIVENFSLLEGGKFTSGEGKKNPGVKPFMNDDYATAQLLFGGDPDGDNEGFFYVIPRNSSTDGQGGEGVNIKINYGVLTIDPSLATTLSGTKDFGSEVENQIYKEDIFGTGFDFEAGKQYEIHIHLGMTSVKIDAVVTDWVEGKATDVDLPDNQPEGAAEPASTGANANNIVVGTVFKFASTWDPGYTASAKIMAISGKIVTIKVTGCAQAEANGTYYVNIDDFGNAITAAVDENPAKLNANAEEIPVYKTADDATNKTNYLFKVSIKKNSEE
jgi:hypothetical protein